MISREIQALRDEFKKETTLPHSRPGQGHTQYYAEWLEIKLSEKQNNWISVDDRLPELNQLCLVYTSLDGKPHGYDISNYYKMSNCDLEVFSKDLNSQNIKVTHWQPLPGAPK